MELNKRALADFLGRDVNEIDYDEDESYFLVGDNGEVWYCFTNMQLHEYISEILFPDLVSEAEDFLQWAKQGSHQDFGPFLYLDQELYYDHVLDNLTKYMQCYSHEIFFFEGDNYHILDSSATF